MVDNIERTRRPFIAVVLKWSWLRPTVDPLSGTVHVGTHDSGVSTADRAALEHALRLAERWDAQVIAVTRGPVDAEAALRDALAVGVDKVLRVDADDPTSATGEVPATSLIGDGREVARSLAAAVRKRFGAPDLVLCGDRSGDRGTGTVPGFLAAEFDAAQALGLVELRCQDSGELLAHRRLDQGKREVLRVPRPAVVSVEAAGVRLRRAALPDVVAAQHAAIAVESRSTSDYQLPRMHATGPYRPRTHALAPPTGSPTDRLRALTGACSDRAPARVVGPLEADEAVDELLAFLSRHGYAPDNEKSRP